MLHLYILHMVSQLDKCLKFPAKIQVHFGDKSDCTLHEITPRIAKKF